MIKRMEVTKGLKPIREETHNILKPLSRQEIYDILEESSQQVQDGKHRPAEESLEALGRKYGVSEEKL